MSALARLLLLVTACLFGTGAIAQATADDPASLGHALHDAGSGLAIGDTDRGHAG